MDSYIKQLVEDLEKVAANPPTPPYIEAPPNMEDDPVLAELALTPYKPISDWTGIDWEVFPVMTRLTVDQMNEVNQVILKVFESLNIELIDAPEDLPPDLLYDVLTNCWDEPVQYLPSSGFDLELCTGDSDTCPYGEYCDHGNCEPFLRDDDLADDGDVEELDNGLPF